MRTLADFLNLESPDPASVLPIFLEVIDRVSELHSTGRSQMGLLPQTIELSDEGKVVIRLTQGAETDKTVMVGDTKYTSPEIFRERVGDESKLRVASDIYVLGFIFYEILLGKKTFASQFAEIHPENQNFEWLAWHMDPEKRARPLKELIPDCPALLSDTLQRMMEKRSESRIASVNEVSEALRKVKVQLELEEAKKSSTIIIPLSGGSKDRAARALSLVKLVLISEALVTFAMLAWLLYWTVGSTAIESAQKTTPPSKSTLNGGHQGADKGVKNTLYPTSIVTETGPMVLVAEGEFVMGSDHGRVSKKFGYSNESPAHRVRLQAYYIDQFEVTNQLYKKFCDRTGRSYPPNPYWDANYLDKPDYPVVNVSWQDAQDYAEWGGKRLPSEAEWEKAARGQDSRSYPWGNQPGITNIYGLEDGFAHAAPIGSFPLDKSPYNVMDLAGNVLEWVEDQYTLYEGSPASLTDEERKRRVVRGGGFILDKQIARTTNRLARSPETRDSSIGFRCSIDADKVLKSIGLEK